MSRRTSTTNDADSESSSTCIKRMKYCGDLWEEVDNGRWLKLPSSYLRDSGIEKEGIVHYVTNSTSTTPTYTTWNLVPASMPKLLDVHRDYWYQTIVHPPSFFFDQFGLEFYLDLALSWFKTENEQFEKNIIAKIVSYACHLTYYEAVFEKGGGNSDRIYSSQNVALSNIKKWSK